jgi:putative MATE family efflux protein
MTESRPNPPRLDSTAQMGRSPVGRLMVQFSLPPIIGMLVNAFYNVVDRIFVGQGIGEMGIAGVTISFPIVMTMVSFSILVGVGANTLFAIRMGEGKRDEAERILGNALAFLFGFPLLASIAGLVWLEPLLRLLGCSTELMAYAKPYARIILFGIAVNTTGHGLTHFIRSDGHPRLSMVSQLIGGVANTLLDPLFIFVFRWGTAGAAWATVIAQALSFVWCVAYFVSPHATTRIHRRNLRPAWRQIVFPFLAIGFSPFVMSLCNSLLNAILNRSLQHHGGDRAVAVMGIISAFMSIVFMPVFGMTQGVQPLMGYNYGARKFARVRKFFWLSLASATAVLSAGCLAAQLFPAAIVRMFARGDGSLVADGVHALHVFTALFPTIGVPIVVGTLFQALGKAVRAGVLALSRQLLFFIPLILIFGRLWGLTGVYAAAPASDFLAFVLALVLIRQFFGQLRKEESAARGGVAAAAAK